MYSLENYILFRRGRKHRTSGGVAIYVLESAIAAYDRLMGVESENEDLWLRLKLKDRKKTAQSMFKLSPYEYKPSRIRNKSGAVP